MMLYEVGDLFIDIRGKEHRRFVITEVIIDGVEPVYYRIYISPDDKEDVWEQSWIKRYLDKHVFLHYPMVK